MQGEIDLSSPPTRASTPCLRSRSKSAIRIHRIRPSFTRGGLIVADAETILDQTVRHGIFKRARFDAHHVR
jgi:hypothetical protein